MKDLERLTAYESQFAKEISANILIKKFEDKGVLPSFKNTKYDLERKKDLEEMWDKADDIIANIKKVYEEIWRITDHHAAIIVAGYPKLFGVNGYKDLIDTIEVSLVNAKVSAFNKKIESAVIQLQKNGMDIHFVNVETEFDKDGGHGAYSDVPWINEISFIPKSEDLDHSVFGIGSKYSMHPNAEGVKAYARCVNDVIEDIWINDVSGTVWDSDIQGPAAGVSVLLRDGDKTYSAITDKSGAYTIKDIPRGTYDIIILINEYTTEISPCTATVKTRCSLLKRKAIWILI